jgi:hypothetical protein
MIANQQAPQHNRGIAKRQQGPLVNFTVGSGAMLFWSVTSLADQQSYHELALRCTPYPRWTFRAAGRWRQPVRMEAAA